MEEGVVRSRFGHFRSFLEVCVVVFVTHVVPFLDKSHFLIPVARLNDIGYTFVLFFDVNYTRRRNYLSKCTYFLKKPATLSH